MTEANLRTLARGGQELVQVVGEKLHVLARAVLENEREAAGCSDAGNRRRREARTQCLAGGRRASGSRSGWMY